MISMTIQADYVAPAITCDATGWFEQAEIHDIIDLLKAEANDTYACDSIVDFVRKHDAKVEHLFRYAKPPVCEDYTLSIPEIYAWLKEHRPDWVADIKWALGEDREEDCPEDCDDTAE